MCSKVYYLDLVKFLSAPGLAWQAANSEEKLQVLTDINMLLKVEKGIRAGNVIQFINLQKLVTNI